MLTKDEWIQREEESIDEIHNQINKLESRWFKTSIKMKLAKFLKSYVEEKDKLVKKIK